MRELGLNESVKGFENELFQETRFEEISNQKNKLTVVLKRSRNFHDLYTGPFHSNVVLAIRDVVSVAESEKNMVLKKYDKAGLLSKHI